MSDAVLHLGDCRTVLATLEPEGIDSVVCDPPYGLSFMGRKWDGTGVAFEPATWAAVLRVLKPGGHLMAFGGTRTCHRMAVAIEDAGFEIRDSVGVAWPSVLAWLYSTGFPKSVNMAIAIDRELGVESEAVGVGQSGTTRNVLNAALYPETFGGEYAVKRGASPEAQAWEGWGSALAPSWEPIILARKPIRERNLAAQVLKTGTGGINIDATRTATGGEQPAGSGKGTDGNRRTREGGDMPGNGGNVTPPAGRWPKNAVLIHHPACVPKGIKRVCGSNGVRGVGRQVYGAGLDREAGQAVGYADPDGMESVVEWDCVPGECPVAVLGAQSGKSASVRSVRLPDGAERNRHGVYGSAAQHGDYIGGFSDSGDASRFFPTFHPFLYVPKASRTERDAGLDRLPGKTGGEATGRKDGSAGLNSPRAGAGRTAKESGVGVRNIHPT